MSSLCMIVVRGLGEKKPTEVGWDYSERTMTAKAYISPAAKIAPSVRPIHAKPLATDSFLASLVCNSINALFMRFSLGWPPFGGR